MIIISSGLPIGLFYMTYTCIVFCAKPNTSAYLMQGFAEERLGCSHGRIFNFMYSLN
jgi:hypothetical protein